MLEALKNREFVVLDTETTGLDRGAEIVEISVLRNDGKVLLDTLVIPVKSIPQEAIDIHGISTLQAMKGKGWAETFQVLMEITNKYPVVIYNAGYDLRLIEQTCEIQDSRWFDLDRRPSVYCAMLEYAEYYGEWDSYRDSYKWQSLINASKQQGVTVENAHRALGDCNMTLSIIHAVWAKEAQGGAS